MSDKKRKNKKHSKNELVKKDKKKFSAKHPKITVALRILLLLIIMIAVVGTGIVVGMLYGGWGDDFEITKEELVIGSSNSVVLDKDGNKLAELSGDENRKIIKLDQMPENLKNAYVAIEDERFYKHNGVDFKRTAAAVAQYVIHAGKSSFGGSTITQQLVKNITKDDERSGKEGVIRKVKEWAKAYQIERMLSKDQILELYLNIIFVGGSNNLGVEVGAEYYFNKSASDLDLAECAFLAGINNSPNSYNPYGEKDKSELIKKRTKTVLGKMLELGMVQQNEYDEAVKKVEDGLPFQKAENLGSIYSYHTDATISQVIEDVAKELSDKLIDRHPHVFGNTEVHSTQEILDNWDKLKKEEKTYRKSVLDGISKSQSALMSAQKISKKVVKVGFEWDCVDSLKNCIQSEYKEFEEAVKSGDKEKMEDEMGDIFFATVNLARWYKIDAEQALLRANKKFTKRFRKMEEIKTKPFEEYTYDEFNDLWKQAKVLVDAE